MLSLISPAKALDFEAAVPKTVHTLPRLLEESTALAAVMKGKSVAELARLSEALGNDDVRAGIGV